MFKEFLSRVIREGLVLLAEAIIRKYGNTTCIINQSSVKSEREVKIILERIARMTVEDIKRMELHNKSLNATV